MVVITNILALPLALLLWSLDAFITLASARLILGQLAADWAGRASRGLAPLTDWAPDSLRRLVVSWFKRPLPSWAVWATVIGAALVLRNVLVGTLLAVSHPAAP
jgi:hypothetical protein